MIGPLLALALAGGPAAAGGVHPPGTMPRPPSAYHNDASNTCAAFPLRTTGVKHYFCDCRTGAQNGCVAGSDANASTANARDCSNPASPCQTWAQVIATFNRMAGGDTIALCKGGSWNVTTPGRPADCHNHFANPNCAAGSSLTDAANTSTCDIRDYPASWGGTAKPVLHASTANPTRIIAAGAGSPSGVRVLNLEFRGGNAGPRGGTYSDHRAIVFGACNPGSANSWLVCNNTFSNFRIGIEFQWTPGSTSSGINIWGNRFTMNDLDAILGGPGNNGRIDANFFDNNGGFSHPVTGNNAHVVYLTSPNMETFDASVVNNEFRRSGAGSSAPGICSTGILQSHDMFTRLNVENNIIDGGAGAAGGCWGMDLRAAASLPTHFRNMTVRRNTVITGGLGIAVGQAPNVIIENNLVAILGAGKWKVGIGSPQDVARSGVDDVQNNTTIRNNTVYITGSGTFTGIEVTFEGTGHVIANNAVHQTRGKCFSTPLSAASYAFVGNNACYGGAAWGTTYDETPHITGDPRYVDPSKLNFWAGPGSPLKRAGNRRYSATEDIRGEGRDSTHPTIGAWE